MYYVAITIEHLIISKFDIIHKLNFYDFLIWHR